MRQLGAAGPSRPRVPANNRQRDGEASIRSPEEQDQSRHRSAHREGLELSTGTGPYGACRSTQCCLAVCSRWAESITRLGGFRALKRTTEAPYTTKVNYREAAKSWNHPNAHTPDVHRLWLSRSIYISWYLCASSYIFLNTHTPRRTHRLLAWPPSRSSTS